MILYPFQPSPGGGKTAAPNAGVVDVTGLKGSRQVCVTNLAATVLYVRFAATGNAAIDVEMPIPGNTQRIFTKDADLDRASVFCAGVGNGHLMPGLGN